MAAMRIELTPEDLEFFWQGDGVFISIDRAQATH